MRSGLGRSQLGDLPSAAPFRARGVNLRRRTRRVPRQLGTRGFNALGNFQLLIGKFCGYPLY